MKKATIVLSLLLAGTLVSVSCKDKASNKVVVDNVETAADRDEVQKKLPVIRFEKTEHDFGTIRQGEPQETSFPFTNTGEAPLIISDAKSSCGCTVPEYPKNIPIDPGQSAELVVTFNGNGKNKVIKTITLTTNTKQGKETLRVRAFVNPKNKDQKVSATQ